MAKALKVKHQVTHTIIETVPEGAKPTSRKKVADYVKTLHQNALLPHAGFSFGKATVEETN